MRAQSNSVHFPSIDLRSHESPWNGVFFFHVADASLSKITLSDLRQAARVVLSVRESVNPATVLRYTSAGSRLSCRDQHDPLSRGVSDRESTPLQKWDGHFSKSLRRLRAPTTDTLRGGSLHRRSVSSFFSPSAVLGAPTVKESAIP